MALTQAFALEPTHIYLWLWPQHISNRLLMLTSHRDTYITYDTRTLIHTYLDSDSFRLLYIQAIGPN